MPQTFKIVFNGEITAGHELADVQGKLLKLYKGNHKAVQALFAGKPVVVKDKLDKQTAIKYKAVFEKAGATTKIVPVNIVPQQAQDNSVAHIQQSRVQSVENNAESFLKYHSSPDKLKQKPGFLLNAVAVAIVLAIFACLGLRFWASNKLDTFISIDHVTANKNQVAIHAAGSIYLQSHSGNLEQLIELNEFGINGQLADLELLDDGSLLIGDMEMKTILRCNPQSKTCQAFAPTGNYTLEDNFKFLVDQSRKQLYIADTNNHRLLIQSLTDSTCFVAETKSHLSYPNDMARDDGDTLYLCDTNRFRVISLKVTEDAVFEIGNPLRYSPSLSSPSDLRDAINDPESMKAALEDIKGLMDDIQHAKPFALTIGPDKNLWIAQLNTVMSNGTINIISSTGDKVGEVDLDAGAVPVDIVNLNGNLLVVDSGLVRAYTVDPITHFRTNFGDEKFQEHMEDIYSNRILLEGIKSWGLKGTFVLLFSAIAVLLIAKKQGVA